MMKWSEVPTEWQLCYQVSWQSMLEGSRPIGAIVIDDKGNVVSTGKSATFNHEWITENTFKSINIRFTLRCNHARYALVHSI